MLLKSRFKKTLASFILSCASFMPLTRQAYAQKPKSLVSKLQCPQTFSDYYQIYNTEFSKETERRKYSLKNFKEFNIIRKGYNIDYQDVANFLYEPSDYELRQLRRFLKDVAEKSLEESIYQIEWTNKEVGKIEKLFNYEIYLKTYNINGNSFYFPTLKEEERLDKKEQDKVTFFSPKKVFPYELHTGIRFSSKKESLISAEGYAKLKTFKLFNIEVKKAEINLNSEKQTKLRLQKILNPRWYLEIELKAEDFTRINKATISLTQELKNPNSRFQFITGYQNPDFKLFNEYNFYDFQKDYFIGIGYLKIF